MPGTYALDLYRGDSRSWRFTLWSDDERTVPVDLAGAVVAAEIRDKSAGTFIVDLDCVVTTPNIVDMSITPDMYATCPSRGVWDIQVTFPSGWVSTFLGGKVTVTVDVTDSLSLPAVIR